MKATKVASTKLARAPEQGDLLFTKPTLLGDFSERFLSWLDVGLPDKGQAPATLPPSSLYAAGASPFGVLDMVGNAGDWVGTRGGYERTFMGGFYAFNPEECMTFKSLPDTGEPPWRKITVRCVQNAGGNAGLHRSRKSGGVRQHGIVLESAKARFQTSRRP